MRWKRIIMNNNTKEMIKNERRKLRNIRAGIRIRREKITERKSKKKYINGNKKDKKKIITRKKSN